MEHSQVNKIKNTAEEFFSKMTMPASKIEANFLPAENGEKEAVDVQVTMPEPQILIGQGGQTLFEIQRLLRTILNKKLQTIFYLNLDINEYKKKKTEYLKNMAKDLANEVALSKQEKILPPMPAYERRVVHAELSNRTDVVTESQGEGLERHIVIKAK